MKTFAPLAIAATLTTSALAVAACAPAMAGEVAAPVTAATAGAPATVTLNLERGARTGHIMVVLFDSEAAYNGGGQPVRQAMVDAANDPTTAVFEGLPTGTYAAKMFHDVNGNGRMDTNPFGMPTEPYAFSNNAVGNMGPAGWDRASFPVNGDTTQTIRIR